MDPQIQEVEAFEPNYRRACETCGDLPTVDVVVNGRMVRGRAALCGACTWGGSDMRNPKLWNWGEV
jgi:hypothetical protein